MKKTVPALRVMIEQAGKFIIRDPVVKDMFYRRKDEDGWVGMHYKINPSRSLTSKRLKKDTDEVQTSRKINIFSCDTVLFRFFLAIC